MARRSPLVAALVVALGIATAHFEVARRAGQASGGCGPASLYALSEALGQRRSRADIERAFGSSVRTCNFADISGAARATGIELIGEEVSIETLRNHRPLGIMHIDGFHFVAVVGYEEYGPRVVDPVGRWEFAESVWPYEYLSDCWDGKMLVAEGARWQRGSAQEQPTSGRR